MSVLLRTGHGKAVRHKEIETLSTEDARKIVEAVKDHGDGRSSTKVTIHSAEKGDVSYRLSTQKIAQAS